MTSPLFRSVVALACALSLATAACAQLPTPTYGFNIGNTLEPPGGEGSWGPAVTQNLVNAIADAGFNTVRIPCAWDTHANQTTRVIDPVYMARVKQVVDWCLARNLYVIINCHWDNGWLERNITATVNPTIDAKMAAYWTQIATTFRDYDHHLLFAGANEPAADTAAKVATLVDYYETFITAVRATGGNNTGRWLVVQGPNTDIDVTDSLFNTLPADPTPGRLAVEVHFYAPYQWALMETDADWGKMFYFWGAGYHHPTLTNRNPTWGEETYVAAEFQKMADKFVSRGVPVILGEFQAMKRSGYSDLTGTDYDLHLAARTFYHKYIVDAANSRGIKPIYWDIPGNLFDWTTGALKDSATRRVLTGGSALPRPDLGDSIPAGSQWIYTDSVQSPWANWSWAAVITDSTAKIHSGSAAVAVTIAASTWGAFYAHTTATDTKAFSSLEFWIHGGSAGGQKLQIGAVLASGDKPVVPLAEPKADTWQRVRLSLDVLGAANVTDLVGFKIQGSTSAAQPVFYLDDIVLIAAPVAPLCFDQWVLDNFTSTERQGVGISGALCDPDHVGLTNFMRYALGLAAHGPVVVPVQVVPVDEGGVLYAGLQFPRRAGDPDLVYRVEASTDLVNWTAVGQCAADDGSVTAIRDTVARSAQGRRFLRLVVTSDSVLASSL